MTDAEVPTDPHREALHALLCESLRRGETVQTGIRGLSMSPSILPGDVCTVASTDTGDVRLGDVVLVQGGADLVLHRVVSVRGRGPARVVRCKGDRRALPDPPCDAARLLGRLVEVNGHPVPPAPWLARLSRWHGRWMGFWMSSAPLRRLGDWKMRLFFRKGAFQGVVTFAAGRLCARRQSDDRKDTSASALR